MQVFGVDIGVVALLACVTVAAMSFFLACTFHSDLSVLDRIDEKWKDRLHYLVFVSAFVGIVFSSCFSFYLACAYLEGPKIEKTTEYDWRLVETHKLASLQSFDGDGRVLDGSVSGSGTVFGFFGSGSGSGSVTGSIAENPSAGVYMLVELTEDGGYRKLSVDAENAVIYPAANDYRAELWEPVKRGVSTLVENNWWFPTHPKAERYKDGYVGEWEKCDKWDENSESEWRIYVPDGSIVTGTWDMGAGMTDGSAPEE